MGSALCRTDKFTRTVTNSQPYAYYDMTQLTKVFLAGVLDESPHMQTLETVDDLFPSPYFSIDSLTSTRLRSLTVQTRNQPR